MSAEPSDPAGTSRRRGLFLSLFKLLVSGGLLWLLLSRVNVTRLWELARTASPVWLFVALGFYLSMVLVSAWRWKLLLQAQGIRLRFGWLTSSFLVATFFNNFLPSNIGGDVVRIADTAPAAGSRTLAATIVLLDRALGLLGLVLLAAIGATASPNLMGADWGAWPLWGGFAGAVALATPAVLRPAALTSMLRPLRRVHPVWIDERLDRLTRSLHRFRQRPATLGACFVGAVAVQAILAGFYLAIARSLGIPVGFVELAVIVPLTFLVQMVPVSVNGFGVREAAFAFYFERLGLPLESAILVSVFGAALIMLFSVSGGVTYLLRRKSGAINATAS